MQFRFFKIPPEPNPDTVEELNRFLRGHRVVQVQREFVAAPGGGYWAICVEYVQQGLTPDPGRKKERVDYREVLSEEAFQVFARLRGWRKRQAETEGVPLYTLFTNEQLADIANRRPGSAAELATIEGIGEARSAKYGEEVLRIAGQGKAHETDRPPDRADRGT